MQTQSAFLACLALALSSCSAFVSNHQAVHIQAAALDTRILVNGTQVGTGQADVDLPRDRSHVVVFERDGQQSYRVIDHVWSIYGKLDTLGSIAFLVPGFGLLCPGSRSLDPRSVFETEPAPTAQN